MSRLVERLWNKEDLVRSVKKVCAVKLDYGWRFRNIEEGYIDISCGSLKFRVNGFDVVDNSDEARALLVKEARAFEDYIGRELRFRAFYFGVEYKKFNPH